MNSNLIIFTDLDGTLLDINYSFKEAIPALKLIKEKNIPLILCSSKTRVEIEHYRKKLKNTHPFISENGGGIFIPKDCFRFLASASRLGRQILDFSLKIVSGVRYLFMGIQAYKRQPYRQLFNL